MHVQFEFQSGSRTGLSVLPQCQLQYGVSGRSRFRVSRPAGQPRPLFHVLVTCIQEVSGSRGPICGVLLHLTCITRLQRFIYVNKRHFLTNYGNNPACQLHRRFIL